MECKHSFLEELTQKPQVAFCQYCGEKQILENPEGRFRMMEWISVKDSLPRQYQMVLLAAPTSYAGYKGIIYGWLGNEGQWMTLMRSSHDIEVSSQTADGKDPVTHWMPMPKLPGI